MTAIDTTATVPPAKRKRPFGVNAILVLSTLSALYGVGAARVLYFHITRVIPSLSTLQLERWLMIYFIGSSVVQIFVIIGLWQLKRWGWFLVMMDTGFGMFLNIWAYFHGQPNYIAMAASVLIVFYMNQREVQHAFLEHPPAGSPAPDGSAK